MKILYIITKSNWGGAQRHVYDLATAMRAKGHEVYVALGGNGVLQQRLETAGIFTHSIASMGRDISINKDAGSFKEIYAIIKNKKPDIIHLHSPKAAGLGALAGRLLRVKSIIVTAHGFAFNEDRPLHQKALIAFFSWLTMIFAHATIVLSEREYKQAVRFPFVKNKLKLIPPGMKAPIFISVDGAKMAIGKLIGIDLNALGKKTLIATVAELHPNKGLAYLVEAMAIVVGQFPQAVSVIMSDGQDKAMLQKLIEEKKLGQNVFLTGYVEGAADYLKAFSMYAFPSIKEGLPYALLEAGYASLPVVTTPVGGIPEIIEEMKSGILVRPKNARELAHGISFMLEHPDERRKYGAALRERVVTKFSLEKMLKAVEEVYAKQP